MCGITGIFHINGEPIDESLIKRMNKAIAHRGPDGEGSYVDRGIGLGHRRLAILDLSDTGHQPMLSQDRQIAVAYNGEMYNFRELRTELQTKGHEFISRTDTEVLIHGYEEEGIHFVQRLNGMFAFALWDAHRETLYLVRDRYGIKPLYWWFDGKSFVFSSEIKALLTHPKISVQLNPDALNEYFTFQNMLHESTLFKDIELFPAAHIFRIQRGDNPIYRERYWDYQFIAHDPRMIPREAEEATIHLLEQAVERQLVADVPVGSYLSGGLDSGSIVSLASDKMERLSTFTCGFHMQGVQGVEAHYDERREAEMIANFCKTRHYEMVLNSQDIARVLPKVVYHLEDPRIGMSYPHYYISQLSSKFVKVCLSGSGGDELYAGYPWRYYRIFRSVSKEDFFRQYYAFWQRLVSEEDKTALFTPELWNRVLQRDTFYSFRHVFALNNLNYSTPEDHIANSLYFEIKTFLHALFLVGDKLSMAHGLEERFPFMDNDLVEFAQRIPIRYKLGNLAHMKRLDENELRKLRRYYMECDDGKNVLRRAINHLVPQEVVRRKKQGFSSPEESWYRGDTLEYVKQLLLDKRAASRDYIQTSYMKHIIDEHTSGQKNYRLLIWSFLCFEWWCKIFLEKQSIEGDCKANANDDDHSFTRVGQHHSRIH